MVTEQPIQLSSAKTYHTMVSFLSSLSKDIPFYSDIFKKVENDVLIDILSFPIITKDVVRTRQKDMILPDYIRDHATKVIEYTSGSTGIPLSLIRTQAEIMTSARALWKARSMYCPTIFTSTGMTIFPISRNKSLPSILKKGAIIQATIGSNTKDVDAFLDLVDVYCPIWLSGPPALLAIIAERIKSINRHLHTKFSFIESCMDSLNPQTRLLLSEVFNCPVANQYGCMETYSIAYECPNGKMHLCEDNVFVELLLNSETQEYEIVVSSLLFKVMPFIRYRVGDIVRSTSEKCTCGNPAPLLGEIVGRIGETIAGTTLLGNHVFFQIITWLSKTLNTTAILQYQIIQTSLENFRVILVLDDSSQLEELAFAFADIAAIWLPQAIFSFEVVDRIAPTSRGKLCFFLNQVQ